MQKIVRRDGCNNSPMGAFTPNTPYGDHDDLEVALRMRSQGISSVEDNKNRTNIGAIRIRDTVSV